MFRSLDIKKALFNAEYNTAKNNVNLTDSTVTETEQEIFNSVANALFSTKNKRRTI